MPAFHPEHHGPLHLPNPVATNHSDGYKAAIYEDFPSYGAHYPEHPTTGARGPSLPYHRHAERYQQPVPSSAYGAPTPAFLDEDWYPDHPCLHPLPAPMMAPVHVGERYVPPHDGFAQTRGYTTVPEATYPKEEKPTGGVSAKLDYDIDQMTEFVTESTVAVYELYSSPICLADIDLLRSIKPGHHIPPAFRKWVLQVLNATRLPSATIMLSLSYLAIRIRQLSAGGSLRVTERTFYKMITVALILGSKFLDDNTFQNKSWAEVSNIPVYELNHDEREWLVEFGHRLHHDPRRVDGFDAAQEQWKAFQIKFHPRLPALQPLDTNLRRHQSMQILSAYYLQQQAKNNTNNFGIDSALVDRSYPQPAYSQYDGSWHGSGYRSTMDRSPLSSATHSGPQTPEYMSGTGFGWGPFNQYAPRPQYSYPPVGAYTPQSAGPPEYQLPPFRRHCVTAWNCHGSECQCQMCRQQNPMLPRFGHAVMA